MGSASGGRKKYSWSNRNKQRANLSFFLVLAFFMVFGVIVFTEIFFMDDRQGGVLVRHSSLSYHGDLKEEYEERPQNEDYISIRDSGGPSLDETVGALLLAERHVVPLPLVVEEKVDLSKPQVVTEHQLPPYPRNKTATDGNWQPVNGTKFKFFVFSAFFDRRPTQNAVRIIAATKTRLPERVWCRFWYKPEGNSTVYTSKTILAKIKVIRENWNLKYSACFILCTLLFNQTAPVAVSVVAKVLLPPANLLVVNDFYNESKPTNQFGVCIKPLHYEYNRALQILEFIELNRLLGVSHFTFYNHTIGPQVNCILEDYIARGIVTLLPWHLNIPSQKEIRTEGLFAALNDCLYRSMYKFSHILLIDLDEYIIPHRNNTLYTLPQLMEHSATKTNPKTTGSYSFQNAFFYLQWGDAEWVYSSYDSIATNLITLKKTRRKNKLHPHKQRSKYICVPEFVVEAGNHFVWEFIPGHGTYNVPSDAAFLHHYRICEFGGDDCIKSASTLDTTVFKYREKLVNSVKAKYKQFKNKCNLNDLPPSSNKHQFLKIFKESLGSVKHKETR